MTPLPCYRCTICGWEGPTQAMEADVLVGDDLGEWGCDTICPLCGEWQELDDYLLLPPEPIWRIPLVTVVGPCRIRGFRVDYAPPTRWEAEVIRFQLWRGSTVLDAILFGSTQATDHFVQTCAVVVSPGEVLALVYEAPAPLAGLVGRFCLEVTSKERKR